MATPPIALCEVQGYAHRAALDGAELLDAFGLPDGRPLARRTHAGSPPGSGIGSGWTARSGRIRRWRSTATAVRSTR